MPSSRQCARGWTSTPRARGLPWLSCKKEILSSRISRTKGITSVEVSVSDDFDTPGTGVAEGRIATHDRVSDDSILRALEKLGADAHGEAESDQKSNRCYCGYQATNSAAS
jgi:hypothetical protein